MTRGFRDQPTARKKRRWLAWLGILLLSLIAVPAALPLISPSVETLAMDDAARAGADGKYIALSDGIDHYEASGPEGAPAVVFVHGISNPYHVWDANCSAVADAGYRVVRYDRYGVGFSARPREGRHDSDLFDRQLLELVGKLKARTPLTPVGFSFATKLSCRATSSDSKASNGTRGLCPRGFRRYGTFRSREWSRAIGRWPIRANPCYASGARRIASFPSRRPREPRLRFPRWNCWLSSRRAMLRITRSEALSMRRF